MSLPLLDEHDLLALLEGYISGDVLARKALVDALDEAGDDRTERVRAEAINWHTVTRAVMRRLSADALFDPVPGHVRFQIECARVGSPTTPVVTEAVRDARRRWLARLFPEVTLVQTKKKKGRGK